MSLIGSTIPFPATEGQRAAKGDPRRSIAARYPGKADYLDEVSHAAQCLIDAGYLCRRTWSAFSRSRPPLGSARICAGIRRRAIARSLIVQLRAFTRRRSDEGDVISVRNWHF